MESPRSTPALACAPALALALALAAILTLSGCVVFGAADRPWHEDADPEALLSAMADATDRADNYTLELGFGPVSPGGPEGSEGPDGSGTRLSYEVSDSPAAVRATLTRADGSELVVVYPEDGEALLHDTGDLLGAPTEWVRGDALLPAPAPAEVFDLASLSALVDLVAGMEEVEAGPAESIGGAEVLPLTGLLPAVSDGAAAERGAVAPLLGEDTSGALDVSVWVDRSGFPVRMESSGEEASLWLEFSDRGRTSFHVPNGDEVSEPVAS
ncbi:hypothetical protein NE857_05190 [Nocardiopsis exhalans]|uniref:LppX_LprAFG lipoprotein n=1 Tax=Nocardiopsis exhalans TaxID=163604 RepID=A0ABY5DAI9_9ACTN|nr:hypothetical protein [Nocardiopsis exhalans]USY21037.1 hypothetical protein NE857_05190 [Nocardiopsis exhalans]